MDMLDYLEMCGWNERFDFDTHEEARAFGHQLRENLFAEGIRYGEVEVSISVTTVRVKAVEGAFV